MTRLLLASTSPQRRAILEQLGLEFDVVAPDYVEHDEVGLGPVEAVRAHALGKARSVAGLADSRPVLGVDTAVVLDGRTYGKPASAGEAAVVTPSSASSGARPGVRFQAVTGKPARARLAAIAAPIVPRPMKATGVDGARSRLMLSLYRRADARDLSRCASSRSALLRPRRPTR